MAIADGFPRKLVPSSLASYFRKLPPIAQPSLLLTILLVIGFVIMRLWRLTAASLDGDEICSLVLINGSWYDLLTHAIKEATHPPLFYVLLKLWVAIVGESLLWLRLLPAIISILCLIPFFALCRILEIRPVARNLALGIAAVHPYAIFYSQHLRMYCLFMLAGLVSAWCFERYLQTPSSGRLLVLSLANFAVICTHYYGWMIIGFEFLFLLWQRRRWIPMAVGVLLTAILFSPWAWMVGRVLYAGGMEEKLGWISKPGLMDLAWFFMDLTGCVNSFNAAVAISAATLAVVAILLFAYRGSCQAGMRRLAVLALAPVILLFVASEWLSLWGHRHLIFTFWPFILVLADCLSRLPRRAIFAVIMLVVFWAYVALEFHRNDDLKLPWDTLTVSLLDQEHSTSGHVSLYSIDRDLHFPLWFYTECLRTGNLGPFGPHLGPRADISELAAKAARFEIEKVRSLDPLPGQYFWIAYSDSNWKGLSAAEHTLNEHHCRKGDAISARDHFHYATLVPVRCPLP